MTNYPYKYQRIHLTLVLLILLLVGFSPNLALIAQEETAEPPVEVEQEQPVEIDDITPPQY